MQVDVLNTLREELLGQMANPLLSGHSYGGRKALVTISLGVVVVVVLSSTHSPTTAWNKNFLLQRTHFSLDVLWSLDHLQQDGKMRDEAAHAGLRRLLRLWARHSPSCPVHPKGRSTV